MDKVLPYVKHVLKAVAAFLALFITNVTTRLVTNAEPLPETTKDWISFAVTTLGGTWLVWQVTNGPKPAEVSTGRHAKPE